MPEPTAEDTISVNAPVSAPASDGSSPAASILVVDDEAGIQESLEVLLSLENYAVKTAANGEDGLRMLDQSSFDLVLLDLALPGQSGIELLPQFKERQPDLPIIMITAYGTVDNVVEAIRAGAENFIQKPGTTRNFWPTSAPRSHSTAPRKRIFSSSAPSSSAITLPTLWAKASQCSVSSILSRRSLRAVPRS